MSYSDSPKNPPLRPIGDAANGTSENKSLEHHLFNSQLRTNAVKRAFTAGAIGKSATIVMGLVSVALAVRAVGAAPYGLITTLTSIMGILGFLDFGLGNAMIGKLAAAYAKGQSDEIRDLLWNTLAFLAIVATALAITVTVALVLIPESLLPIAAGVTPSDSRIAVVVFGLALALSGITSVGAKVAVSLQRGRENTVVAALLSASLLSLTLVGYLVRAPFLYFAISALAVPVIGCGLQTIRYYVVRTEDLRVSLKRIRLGVAFRMIPEGVPFTALVMAAAIAYQTDLLVITYVAGLAAAASYGLLLRIFSSLTLLFGGGTQQLWASTAHALADGDTAWVRRIFTRTLAITGGGYLLFAGASVALVPFALQIWSGGLVVAPFDLVIAFALWSTYNFVMGQLSSLLNGVGVVGRQAVVVVAMAIVNLPLSVWLTHIWGVSGPLWASLITHSAIVGVPTTYWVYRALSNRTPVDRGSAPRATR